MEAEPKERLHRLVDALPAGELQAAERHLEFLSGRGDPFLPTLLNAPEAVDEGRRALQTGEVVSDRELRAELGI